jgi:hypothetical protein
VRQFINRSGESDRDVVTDDVRYHAKAPPKPYSAAKSTPFRRPHL